MPGDHPTAPRAGEERALAACRDYEHWASEVRRLTEEIAALKCPRERRAREEMERREAVGDFSWFPLPEDAGDSHFREVADISDTPDDFNPHRDGEGTIYRRPNLDEIAERVADCPECSRLVDLIRARRHARQRYGVAKRAVRRIGKLALPGREHVASTAREGGENG